MIDVERASRLKDQRVVQRRHFFEGKVKMWSPKSDRGVDAMLGRDRWAVPTENGLVDHVVVNQGRDMDEFNGQRNDLDLVWIGFAQHRAQHHQGRPCTRLPEPIKTVDFRSPRNPSDSSAKRFSVLVPGGSTRVSGSLWSPLGNQQIHLGSDHAPDPTEDLIGQNSRHKRHAERHQQAAHTSAGE